MRQRIAMCAAIFVISWSMSASAADLKDMIGKWRWQQFTIEVSECQGDTVCAKVVEGPKNVGMQMFSSKLTAKGGEWFPPIEEPKLVEEPFMLQPGVELTLNGNTVSAAITLQNLTCKSCDKVLPELEVLAYCTEWYPMMVQCPTTAKRAFT